MTVSGCLVRFSSSVNVSFNNVSVVVVLVKTRSRYLFSSHKLSSVSKSSCARLVKVSVVVALCEVGGPVICRYVSVFCLLSSVVCCCSGLPLIFLYVGTVLFIKVFVKGEMCRQRSVLFDLQK